MNEISHFFSLRHHFRPSKWRVRWSVERIFRPIAKLRHSSEPTLDVLSELFTELIVAQPTKELQPDFTSIPYQQLPPPGHFLASPDFNWDNVPEVGLGWP